MKLDRDFCVMNIDVWAKGANISSRRGKTRLLMVLRGQLWDIESLFGDEFVHMLNLLQKELHCWCPCNIRYFNALHCVLSTTFQSDDQNQNPIDIMVGNSVNVSLVVGFFRFQVQRSWVADEEFRAPSSSALPPKGRSAFLRTSAIGRWEESHYFRTIYPRYLGFVTDFLVQFPRTWELSAWILSNWCPMDAKFTAKSETE